ncbi:protein CASC3-like [Schistocerca americana]|uniref:protein CASC3-like n=1 Tax=Schistocerca americana TaxID=7009 RepID=UPI001F4FB52D|nr:protein CASC3-like [Schistocerca americana]
MSERIRRRETTSGESEGLSESSFDGLDVKKGSEGETDGTISTEGQKSYEYDGTVDNDGDDSRSDCSPPRDGDDGDSDSIVIEYEREEGDGQESVPPKEKKLDDDEDRRNPQYIPKKGTFYEHDDRTVAEDVDEEAADKESERGKEIQATDKKKVWKENENRWSHDRYNEDEQTPKSREELVAIYGYDIRNEEAPPRARRRRRYGRGPNKYTRTWEDEDAYTKTAAALGLRGGRRGGGVVGRGGRRNTEEFPPLQQNQHQQQQISSQSEGEERVVDQRVKGIPSPTLDKKGVQNRNEERQATSGKDGGTITITNCNVWKKDTNQNNVENRKDEMIQKSQPPTWKNSHQLCTTNKSQIIVEDDKKEENSSKWKGTGANRGRGRAICETNDSSVTIGGESGRRSRGRGTSKAGHGGRGAAVHHHSNSDGRSLSETRVSSHDEGSSSESGGAGYQIQSQVITRSQDDASKELSQLSLNEQRGTKENRRSNKNQPNFHQNTERRQAVVPPRMQQENAANRPKRYSSQRQRSLPESNGPTYAQQPHGYYSPGYVQQPVYAEAPPPPPQQPPPPPPPQPAPMMPHHQPPTFPPPYASPTAYMQPVPAPPPPRILQPPHGPPPGPYVQPPPPTAPIINYIPAQGQFPPQGYPAFQGYAPVAPGQPPELFQAQGITYYSTEEQVMSRPPPVAQKRQRAAIPIVPPPEGMSKGRGRLRDSDIGVAPDPGAGGDVTVPPVQDIQISEQDQEPTPTAVTDQYADAPQDTTLVPSPAPAESIVTANAAIEQESCLYWDSTQLHKIFLCGLERSIPVDSNPFLFENYIINASIAAPYLQ